MLRMRFGIFQIAHGPSAIFGQVLKFSSASLVQRPAARHAAVARPHFLTRLFLTLAVVVSAATGGLLTAPAAHAQGSVRVTQGQMVRTADGATCTVGYVEPTRAWTASHCGVNGQSMYNEFGEHIGTLRYFRPGGVKEHDIAYIQFAAGTFSGGNPDSGDGVWGPPAFGEQVCIQGRRSGRNCAPVVQHVVPKNAMFATQDLHKEHGDSGAGAFIPGRPGVVGIYSGTSFVDFNGQHMVFENIAFMPSPDQIASLPYQGFEPRKPGLNQSTSILDYPFAILRPYIEQLEAMLKTSSQGFDIANLRGLAAAYGIYF